MIPLQTQNAIRIDARQRTEFDDWVIVEMPIALLYNGVSHAVMMATPNDLEDFALGFSLSEGIVENAGQFSFIEAVHGEHGLSLEIGIPQARFELLSRYQRHLTAASACGMCGVESLQAAIRPAPRVKSDLKICVADISQAVKNLSKLQPMNRESGGVHAAGFVHAKGIAVREDVGRHNALDKLIGALAKQSLGEGFMVLSSRASYELIHKAAMANIGIVVAISAPTSMAISLAEACNITLICFVRDEQMNIYTHPERIV